MKKAKKVTADGLEIIDQKLYLGKPHRQARLERAEADDAVARKIHHLRTKAGLTQKQLAKLVGTMHSVISRLEDADYEGHSLAMLNRIAAAMDKRVEIRFVPARSTRHAGGQCRRDAAIVGSARGGLAPG
jgi:DNA-binding XRE family transcriptional regulator